MKFLTLSSSGSIFDPWTLPQKATIVLEIAILISCLSDMTGLYIRKRKDEMNLFDYIKPVAVLFMTVQLAFDWGSTEQLAFGWGSFHTYY